jgi:hypothetical protein
MVELQISGAAAPELVWRSWSPPKHALSATDLCPISPLNYRLTRSDLVKEVV